VGTIVNVIIIILFGCVCRQTDIERSLPPGTPGADLEWSPVVSTLRQLVDEAQAIKDDRESIETELKAVKCDMGKWCFVSVTRQFLKIWR